MRYCKKCNEFKDVYSFGKNKSKKDGIDIYSTEILNEINWILIFNI